MKQTFIINLIHPLFKPVFIGIYSYTVPLLNDTEYYKADNMTQRIQIKKHIIFFTLLFMAQQSYAICSDSESVERTEKAALQILKNSKAFKQGKVLKVHLPSKRKETAVYLKDKDKYYTFFGLVTTDCKAYIMKRTHGKY